MKSRFTFQVTIEADTLEEAKQVMAERIDYDEDYGFEYRISWERL